MTAERPFYFARNDAMFKLIFADTRDSGPLAAFLRAALALPEEDLREITLVDPLPARERPGDKLCVLDVRARTATGKSVDIEIQLCRHPALRERVVFYLARMITSQIGSGGRYGDIRRAICILITDFTLVPENGQYHNRYTLRDPATGSEFTGLLEVDTLEMPKLPQRADGTPLWDWLKFVAARDKEDLEMLAQKNPQIGKAVTRLMELNDDERARMIAESQEILRWDIEEHKRYAQKLGWEEGQAKGLAEGQIKGRAEGRAEGLEQGLKQDLEKGRMEGLLATARVLLDEAVPVEKIERATGLSREQILSLTH